MEEQANQATTQTTQTEPKPAVNDKAPESTPAAEAKPTEPYKVFQTEDDYNKSFKSELSKAKNDWMKQAGVSSVDEYKAKLAAAEAAVKEHDSLVKERTDLSEKLTMEELGVDKDRQDDLLTLARAKVTGDMDLKAAAMEVLDKNPAWRSSQGQSIKIGTEKAAPAPEKTSNEKLSERYPWLR